MIAGLVIGFAVFFLNFLFSLIRPEHWEYHEAQHYRVGAFVEKPDCRLGLSLLREGHEVDS